MPEASARKPEHPYVGRVLNGVGWARVAGPQLPENAWRVATAVSIRPWVPPAVIEKPRVRSG